MRGARATITSLAHYAPPAIFARSRRNVYLNTTDGMNLDRSGNSCAATIPSDLLQGQMKERLKYGGFVLYSNMGTGSTVRSI
jgi:hypothetical protein